MQMNNEQKKQKMLFDVDLEKTLEYARSFIDFLSHEVKFRNPFLDPCSRTHCQ